MSIIPIRRGVEAPGESGPGDMQIADVTHPRSVPNSRPATDWLELCRKEFIRRYWEENGDLIDDCHQVYGE